MQAQSLAQLIEKGVARGNTQLFVFSPSPITNPISEINRRIHRNGSSRWSSCRWHITPRKSHTASYPQIIIFMILSALTLPQCPPFHNCIAPFDLCRRQRLCFETPRSSHYSSNHNHIRWDTIILHAHAYFQYIHQ